MPDCDEFPNLYFPNSEGKFAWDDPCWNDDWEHDLRSKGFNSLWYWENGERRTVKKGEKGRYLPCARETVFSRSQTISMDDLDYDNDFNADSESYFKTFEEAMSWSKNNPGKTFTRSPNGKGFIKK